MEYYLAIDIGASSGRHMISWLEDGKIHLKEIYRFENGLIHKNGHLCWNIERLFEEILNGLKKCKELSMIPKSIGIDTWAVDFVALDQEGRMIGDAVSYRDGRTSGIEKDVYQCIPEDELYARTGIQKQPFNTIYQLVAFRKQNPADFQKADKILMIPDYFNYLLTGVMKSEYTNATTTQLVSPETKQWDLELIRKLNIPEKMFLPLTSPGTTVGSLKKEVAERIGFCAQVVQTTTHDTASAVAATPVCDESQKYMYLSSGTWSLMGIELNRADCSQASRKQNFTNEGGYEGRFRYLKNIMGLWMIQSVRHEYEDRYSFAELCDLAQACTEFSTIIDVNDERFLAPENMSEEVRKYCKEKGLAVPQSIGELAAVIYNSLASCYADTVKEMECIRGDIFDCIYIIGGGSNADYLNRLTAKYTGKTVYAGPSEATAIGNILVQMLRDGLFPSLQEARKAVFASFSIKKYERDKF